MKRQAIYGVLVTTFASLIATTFTQCPWQRDVPDLQSACLCSYNLGHELSVQCDMVDWPMLISALHKYATKIPIDLLYINNSTIGALKSAIFHNLEIHNAQLSGCKIKVVATDAFKGLEQFLKNLNLQDNDLNEVPVDSLRYMKSLVLLDFTRNRISVVSDGAFETLNKLHTLKLSDNNVTLAPEALRGLESSLKNLNLKGTRQKDVPEAIRGMKTLAFLDLSQNSIRELPSTNDEDKSFEGLSSLTALNLERNLIQNLGENAFQGVKKTLSSLSLLNNLLPDFPTEAMKTLKELRVLDIGFNLLTDLPTESFVGNPSITLLALDGNPLATIPYGALQHLNNTLRGLSLGGRFLHCDCRLAWVTDWIRNGDLQVTSRERNPQFCGSPPRFRDRGFYSIQPEELTCPGANENIGVATVVSAELDDVSVAESIPIKTSSTTSSTTLKNLITTTQDSTTLISTSSTMKSSSSSSILIPNETTTENSTDTNTTTKVPQLGRSTIPPWRSSANAHQRPSLVTGYSNRNKVDESTEVLVKNAYRQDNSVIIQWGSETANILGFRVVYRLFGDKTFKQGPPLEASEREFKIKNVPSQECIVVCVVSLEEINVSPETVPYTQCREVRTVHNATTNMDKITIAASAAICGTIVIAVIVFIAASRRRSRKLHELHHHHHQQQKLGMKSGGSVGLPIAGLPVNCCASASPGGPLSSLATLNAFNSTKDWDQISAYSTHSTQRPRMYSIEQPPSIIQDDMRSHFSSKGKPRSIPDGQSQHSFSNHSGRYMANNSFPNNLLASRQDLRQSRQSLAMQSERMSRASIAGIHANAHMMGVSHHMGGPPPVPSTAHSVSSSTRRSSRPRSRSRDHNHRPSSRYSTAGSTHTLNNYCDNSDNWTDHDMDIYMARNPTTRNGLVPL